jgi:hypothetical protein
VIAWSSEAKVVSSLATIAFWMERGGRGIWIDFICSVLKLGIAEPDDCCKFSLILVDRNK